MSWIFSFTGLGNRFQKLKQWFYLSGEQLCDQEDLVYIKYLLCVGHWSKCFTCVKLFSPHNHSLRQSTLILILQMQKLSHRFKDIAYCEPSNPVPLVHLWTVLPTACFPDHYALPVTRNLCTCSSGCFLSSFFWCCDSQTLVHLDSRELRKKLDSRIPTPEILILEV